MSCAGTNPGAVPGTSQVLYQCSFSCIPWTPHHLPALWRHTPDRVSSLRDAGRWSQRHPPVSSAEAFQTEQLLRKESIMSEMSTSQEKLSFPSCRAPKQEANSGHCEGDFGSAQICAPAHSSSGVAFWVCFHLLSPKSNISALESIPPASLSSELESSGLQLDLRGASK